MSVTDRPSFNGDAPEPAPAYERTPGAAEGHTGRFRIHKIDDGIFPWCMDYPEPREDGRIGISCSTFEFAVAEFVRAVTE